MDCSIHSESGGNVASHLKKLHPQLSSGDKRLTGPSAAQVNVPESHGMNKPDHKHGGASEFQKLLDDFLK